MMFERDAQTCRTLEKGGNTLWKGLLQFSWERPASPRWRPRDPPSPERGISRRGMDMAAHVESHRLVVVPGLLGGHSRVTVSFLGLDMAEPRLGLDVEVATLSAQVCPGLRHVPTHEAGSPGPETRAPERRLSSQLEFRTPLVSSFRSGPRARARSEEPLPASPGAAVLPEVFDRARGPPQQRHGLLLGPGGPADGHRRLPPPAPRRPAAGTPRRARAGPLTSLRSPSPISGALVALADFVAAVFGALLLERLEPIHGLCMPREGVHV